LLRNLNDLTTTTGVRRAKSKDGTLSKRLEKPHSTTAGFSEEARLSENIPGFAGAGNYPQFPTQRGNAL
jgi:hypothetical protein